MEYNHAPISLRDGIIAVDGLVIADGVKCEIKFTPDVWEGRQLGELTPSSRWIGYKITGSITRRRSTPWLKEVVQKYQKGHETPELTIQGTMDDKNSDYYKQYGSDTMTAVGCVLTGDMTLISLDSGGDVLEDSISFNAKDVL